MLRFRQGGLESIDNRMYCSIIERNSVKGQPVDASQLADYSGDPDFMMSLARGLLVLRLLAGLEHPISLADVSRRSGLSRAAARRCLYTLCRLGYARQGAVGYEVCHDVLALGRGLMNPNSLAVRAQPLLDALRDELGESCSIGVMDGDHVRYVARSETSRIMSINLRIGSRLPLYATSMGRVLLAGCTLADRQAYLNRIVPTAFTPNTVVDKAQLATVLAQVERQRFAIVDEELEVGLRSVSVPIVGPSGVTSAVNVGTSSARMSVDKLRTHIVPVLQQAAREFSLFA